MIYTENPIMLILQVFKTKMTIFLGTGISGPWSKRKKYGNKLRKNCKRNLVSRDYSTNLTIGVNQYSDFFILKLIWITNARDTL